MATGNIPPGRFPDPTGKYAFVGPNFQKHGELAGYRYNPYSDRYSADPKAAQGMGLLPKEPAAPGILEQVAPLAVGLSVAEAAKYGGQQIGPAIGGMFGGSGSGGAGGISAVFTPEAPGAVGAGFFEPVAAGAATPTTQAGLLAGGTPTAGATAAQAGTAAPAGGMGLLGAVPYAGLAGGLALGAKGVKDLLAGEEGTDSWEGLGGRATLGIATGGLSEVARLAGLGRKSTKDYQNERWGALSKELQGLKAANHPGDSDGTWKEGKYAGQKWSFDKASDLAKDDPTHFVGVLGNAETYGDKWLSLPLEKQKAIVAKNIAAGNYVSDKGDVLIKDKSLANQFYEEEVGAAK